MKKLIFSLLFVLIGLATFAQLGAALTVKKADSRYVKSAGSFQLKDSIYFETETDALLATKAPLTGSVRKVLYNNTQLNNTGNTTENTVFTGTIPANSIGANGSFHITMLIGSTNNANAKTVRVKFNGTVIGQGSVVSAMCYQSYFIIRNRNSLTSQVSMYGQSGASGSFVQGTTAGLPATYSFNTGTDITVTVTIQNATGTDTVSLEAFEILAVQ